ncbi:hypothetical protein F511_38371 [Dorcoceras hygrometricum]|uniref:Uncharacterized protein n=1 Tax=Dorcoceras hygrometricum TaxID=472368 RepID=A0A2Z7B3U7_9LAMI|nr:hypothetical protein F511_38371 [Dorcoceras hygrometricum]
MPLIVTSESEDRAACVRPRPALLSSGGSPRTRSKIGEFPEDKVMAGRIQHRYVFPYLKNPVMIRLSISERRDPEDRGEYLARDTRCMRIFVKIWAPPPPSPYISTRNQGEAIPILQHPTPDDPTLEIPTWW